MSFTKGDMPFVSYELREQLIRDKVAEFGFEGRGRLLKRKADEVVFCVGLSRGTWLDRTFVDLGAYFPELGQRKGPKSMHECQVSIQLSSLLPEKMRMALLLFLDGKTESPTFFREVFVSHAMPFFSELKTLDLAREYIKTPELASKGLRVNPQFYS